MFGKANFLNYEHSNIDAAYIDFFNKLMNVVNEIAPSKEIRIKRNTYDLFNREVGGLIHARGKFFLKFKMLKLHIDEETYKKVRYQAQNLIALVFNAKSFATATLAFLSFSFPFLFLDGLPKVC